MAGILNVWGPGQLLAYSGIDGQTDFQHGLVLRTSFFAAGFDIRWPRDGGKIRFSAENLLQTGDFTLTGDYFHCGHLKAVLADAWNILLEGDFAVTPGQAVERISDGKRQLIASRGHLRPELLHADIDQLISRRAAWLRSLPRPEGLPETARRTLAKACSQIKTMVYAPEAEIPCRWTTPDRWPHRHMWLWDSVFHAIGLRHLDASLAREAIQAVFTLQQPDGMIPLCGSAGGYRTAMTQPPVLALGVSLVDAAAPDETFLRTAYPHLQRYLEWDLAHRDPHGCGLLQWHVETNRNCRSGESGMDNSPRFDSTDHLLATDFNAFMAMECEIMAGLARRLGHAADAALWSERHQRLNRQINASFWDEERGFYFDYDVTRQARSPVMASAGFLPLLSGAATPAQAAALAAHLDNPRTFATPLPVASIAVCDSASYSKDMWRGPVWANLNWLIARGFRRYGEHRAADLILSRTRAIIETMYLRYGTLFEFFDDKNEVDPPRLLRKGENCPDNFHQVFHDYGWTATLYVDIIWTGSGR